MAELLSNVLNQVLQSEISDHLQAEKNEHWLTSSHRYFDMTDYHDWKLESQTKVMEKGKKKLFNMN